MAPLRIAIVTVTLLAFTSFLNGQANKANTAPAFIGTSATGPNFTANATSGSPLQVNSTALVTNLNADFLNGLHASAFARLASPNTFTAAQTMLGTVGIGSVADPTPLHVVKGFNSGGGPTILLEHQNTQSDVAIDFRSAGALSGNIGTVVSDGNPRFVVAQNTSGLGPIPVSIAENGGNVGIGVAVPSNILTVRQGGGNVLADGYSTYSSARFKKNIQTYQFALQAVVKLRGVTYNRKADGKAEVGFIAEEVAGVIPQVVSFAGGSAVAIDYSRLTAVLVEAMKQQEEEIELLRARVRKVESEQR